MTRSILTSIGSRYAVMLATLCVVVLNTNFLGVTGQGTVALINLGILIQVALSNFIGGGALVYLASRMEKGKILGASLLWAIASAIISFVVFNFVPIVPNEFILNTVILGFIQSVFIMLLQILLGSERISRYNFVVALQPISLLAAIVYLYIIMHDASVQSFVICSYISFLVTLIASIKIAWPLLPRPDFSDLRSTFIRIFSYGKFAQGGNIFHLLNLRAQYVLLELLVANSRALIGVLSIAMYAAEAIWSIGKSLSVVQYARISNMKDEKEIKQITHSFLRISLLCGVVATLVLVVIPDSFYQKIFGSDISGLQFSLLLLAPGIIANCCSVIFSHYYSGIGLHRKNMIASGLGLIGAIVLGLLLLTAFGLNGAAVAVSISLLIQFVFFVLNYSSKSKLTFSDFIIRKSDFEIFKTKS